MSERLENVHNGHKLVDVQYIYMHIRERKREGKPFYN